MDMIRCCTLLVHAQTIGLYDCWIFIHGRSSRSWSKASHFKCLGREWLNVQWMQALYGVNGLRGNGKWYEQGEYVIFQSAAWEKGTETLHVGLVNSILHFTTAAFTHSSIKHFNQATAVLIGYLAVSPCL